MNEIIIFFSKTDFSREDVEILLHNSVIHSDVVTVFYLSLPEDVILLCKDFKINLVHIPEFTAKYNVQTNIDPFAIKTILSYLYLTHHSSSANVMLLEYSDILFQQNIFSQVNLDKVSLLGSNIPISKCGVTSRSLDYYDEFIRLCLFSKKTVREGLCVGKKPNVVNFLNELILEIKFLFKKGMRNNLNQAAVNKVVHFDLFNYEFLSSDICCLIPTININEMQLIKALKINKTTPCILLNYKANKTVTESVYEHFKK